MTRGKLQKIMQAMLATRTPAQKRERDESREEEIPGKRLCEAAEIPINVKKRKRDDDDNSEENEPKRQTHWQYFISHITHVLG